MAELKKASLYVKTSDGLPGNFHEIQINIGFADTFSTSFKYGLVEEIEYLEDSLGKFVLSYTINDEEYFLSLNPQKKACLTITGGVGALHEAFMLIESMDTAIALPKETPKPHDDTTAYTIYKVQKTETGALLFNAVYKDNYVGLCS